MRIAEVETKSQRNRYFIQEDGIVFVERDGGQREIQKLHTINGYLRWNAGNRGHSVHIELAKAFIPNPNSYPWVLHSDDNRVNNSLANLRWGTPQHNSNDRVSNGNSPKGTGNGRAKLNEGIVRYIRVLLTKGVWQAELAHAYNVCQAHVSDIKLGRLWTHTQ